MHAFGVKLDYNNTLTDRHSARPTFRQEYYFYKFIIL